MNGYTDHPSIEKQKLFAAKRNSVNRKSQAKEKTKGLACTLKKLMDPLASRKSMKKVEMSTK